MKGASSLLRLWAACCYRIAYLLHHKIFLRKGKPLQNAQLVVVGSYLAGGAGKTPFCQWLAEQRSLQGHRVALLCHTYAYDEVKMLRRHFAANPQVQVFETSNRYRTAQELDATGQFHTILCDDGFEDSRLTGALQLVLLWGNAPMRLAELWPLGNNRSLRQDHGETLEIQCEGPDPDIRFELRGFSNINRKIPGTPLAPSANFRQVNVICGIGDTHRFVRDIQDKGIQVHRVIPRPDHDRNFTSSLARELEAHTGEDFVITEKDAARVSEATLQLDQVFIATQQVSLKKASIIASFRP